MGVNLVENKIFGAKETHRIVITTHEEVRLKWVHQLNFCKHLLLSLFLMKPETKLWHELKRITPKISWTRIENTSVFGTPDLLGYTTSTSVGHFFTVELKITSR